MRNERHIQTFIIDWQGITLSVTYEPDYLGMGKTAGWVNAHLTVTAIQPDRARLPITETGYRSHFLCGHEVDQCGGPIAYIRQWLDHAATTKAWQAYQEQNRQFTLF